VHTGTRASTLLPLRQGASVNACPADRHATGMAVVNMAAESSDGLPISPSEKSLTGSLASDENDKTSVSRSPSSYSIREDKWPDLVVSRPRKLDVWWLPRREYTSTTDMHDRFPLPRARVWSGACFKSGFPAASAAAFSLAAR